MLKFPKASRIMWSLSSFMNSMRPNRLPIRPSSSTNSERSFSSLLIWNFSIFEANLPKLNTILCYSFKIIYKARDFAATILTGTSYCSEMHLLAFSNKGTKSSLCLTPRISQNFDMHQSTRALRIFLDFGLSMRFIRFWIKVPRLKVELYFVWKTIMSSENEPKSNSETSFFFQVWSMCEVSKFEVLKKYMSLSLSKSAAIDDLKSAKLMFSKKVSITLLDWCSS